MSASGAKRSAARMILYNARVVSQQLCLLIVAFALALIPLNGIPGQQTSAIVELRTTFLPFSASIQSPHPIGPHVSTAALLSKRVVLARNATVLLKPQNRATLIERVVCCTGDLNGSELHGPRSPPQA